MGADKLREVEAWGGEIEIAAGESAAILESPIARSYREHAGINCNDGVVVVPREVLIGSKGAAFTHSHRLN